MATIVFLGVLAEKAGRRSVEVVVGESVELQKIYPLPFQVEDVLILIDGKVGHLTSPVEDRCSIIIMPMLSGG
jgi:molybdopterin converting factor small subunit